MRRTAGYTSTASAPTTKLRQLAARISWSPLVQQPPSALVYTSTSFSSASNRNFSAKAAVKSASWETAREDSFWESTPAISKRNDGRLGQEEGQRLIESAFSQSEPFLKPERKKTTKLGKTPKEPKKEIDVVQDTKSTRIAKSATKLEDVGGPWQKSNPFQNRISSSLDFVTSQLLRERRTLPSAGKPQSSPSTWPADSHSSPSQRTPPKTSAPGIAIPLNSSERRPAPLEGIRRSQDIPETNPRLHSLFDSLDSQQSDTPGSSQHIPSLLDPSVSISGLSSPRSGVSISQKRMPSAADTSDVLDKPREWFGSSYGTISQRPDARQSSWQRTTTSSSPTVGINIEPSGTIAYQSESAPVQSAAQVTPRSFESSGFSWKPWIRDGFKKRGTAQHDPAPASGTIISGFGKVSEEVPSQQKTTPSNTLPHRNRSGLLAEIWESVPEFLGTKPVDSVSQEHANRPCVGVDPDASGRLGTGMKKFDWTRPEILPSDITGWENLIEHVQRNYTVDAAWEAMACLTSEAGELLVDPDAGVLRDAILGLAIGNDARLKQFVRVASSLRERSGFEWPDLYGNVLYRLLDEAEYERAVFWHSRLYSLFTPSHAVFAALLSHFVVDTSLEMQNTLMNIHDSSEGPKLYDTIIARLFDFGLSIPAREWRRRLLSRDDFPLSEASAPFLQFLSTYYPSLDLTDAERGVLTYQEKQPAYVKTRSETELEAIKKSIHGDHILAKWFASRWTSADFAIDLIHRFGVTALGPHALQSLGLREPGAKALAYNLTKLERLGVSLAPLTYCKVIAYFAMHGEDDLLRGTLTCDIHPDEFEDMETVRMLAEAAETRHDISQRRLMRGIETAMQAISARDESCEGHHEGDLGTFQSALTTIQSDVAETLDLTFDRFGYHPLKWLHPRRRSGTEATRLSQAVTALLRAFDDDVPIPLDYWKRVLYNFGRLGRFKALEHIALELVERYRPSHVRRIPVHPKDIPSRSFDDRSKFSESSTGPNSDGLELWQRALEGRATGVQVIGYIPADLPFSHRQHPLQKLFHQKLQRNMIRWGFDCALRVRHPIRGPAWRHRSMASSAWRLSHISERGIGQGLRILARLRDAGVLIDEQIVQSEVVRRVIAAEFPGRGQAPWMDHHELAIPHVVRLVNGLWGSAILGSPEDLKYMVRARRAKIRQHYWKNRRLHVSQVAQSEE